MSTTISATLGGAGAGEPADAVAPSNAGSADDPPMITLLA
jgi:hypothetical protein